MKKDLWKTADELDALLDQEMDYLEVGEEVPNEIALAISDKVEKTREGVAAVSDYMTWNKGQVDLMKAKIEKLQAAVKSYQKKQDRMKYFVRNLLDRFNTTKIEGNEGTRFSFRKSESVEILDPSQVPDGFLVHKVDVNKAEIKKALKAGVDVPGAQLNINKNVVIK